MTAGAVPLTVNGRAAPVRAELTPPERAARARWSALPDNARPLATTAAMRLIGEGYGAAGALTEATRQQEQLERLRLIQSDGWPD